MNKKYRIKFEKLDKMRFIGHLDLQNLFQRTIKKSNMPIAYSQGFNPHQRLSFAQPLPLGFGSIGEYADILLQNDINIHETIKLLNDNFPFGIEVKKIIKNQENSKSSAAILDCASYDITLPFDDNLSVGVNYINDSEIILFNKKTKKGVKSDDMRKNIYTIETINNNSFNCLISSGSKENLKPEVIVEEIFNHLNKDFKSNEFKINYKRIEMFVRENNEYIPLDKVGIF